MEKIISIKTHFQCNNYCLFCVQGDERFYRKSKSTAEIKKIIEENYQDAKEIIFTGGEVTLRKDIFDLIKYAREFGYKIIQVQSNGRMFSSMEFCQKIVNAGANDFGFALHGSNPELHDTLTRTKNSFIQTITGINNLRKLNKRVAVTAVLTKYNFKDLPEIAKLLLALKVSQHQISFIYLNKLIQNDKKLIEEIAPRYSEVRPYVEQSFSICKNGGMIVKADNFPCCTISKQYHNIICSYNSNVFVFEEDKIINYREAEKEASVKIKPKKCEHCSMRDSCQGIRKHYSDIFGFDEFEPFQ